MKLKNILAENMLRFGVKNLTESNKRNILLEASGGTYTGEPGGKYKLNPASSSGPNWDSSQARGNWTRYRQSEIITDPGYDDLMDNEEAFIAKSPSAQAWKKRNPTYEKWRLSPSNGMGQQFVDSGYAMANFEFQQLQKDHDNNIKYRETQLKTPDPAYAGIASKIVGMIMKALGGADDEQGILTALQMIRKNGGLPVYGNMLQLVKTSPNVKKQFKRNFNTVSDMIYNGGVQAPGYDKDQAAQRSHILSGLGLGITDEEWTRKYAAILTYYNPAEGDFNQPASY